MGRAWAGQAQPLQPRGRGPAESCWGSEEKAACPDVGELLAWMGTWGTDLPRTPLRCPLPARRRRLGVRTVSLAGTLVWGPVGQEGRGGGTDPVRPPAPSPILLLTRGGLRCQTPHGLLVLDAVLPSLAGPWRPLPPRGAGCASQAQLTTPGSCRVLGAAMPGRPVGWLGPRPGRMVLPAGVCDVGGEATEVPGGACTCGAGGCR